MPELLIAVDVDNRHAEGLVRLDLEARLRFAVLPHLVGASERVGVPVGAGGRARASQLRHHGPVGADIVGACRAPYVRKGNRV